MDRQLRGPTEHLMHPGRAPVCSGRFRQGIKSSRWPTDSHPLDEIVTRPGDNFNPQTEVLIVVDDSAELDGEIFNMEEFEGSDWVTISDEGAARRAPSRRAAGVFSDSLARPAAPLSVTETAEELEDANDDDEGGQEVGRED